MMQRGCGIRCGWRRQARHFLAASTALGALAFGAGPAWSQQTDEAAPPTEDAQVADGQVPQEDAGVADGDASNIDEIVITGFRGSLIASQNAKRNANIIADFVSQEDLGKYTDQNLAETLQRVPGIQVTRGQSGEGTFVSIRGLGPNFVVSTVNGRSAFGGSGGDAGLSNRNGFSLDSIAPEQTAGVEVYKSNSADQLDGGIGGGVNILTARPLDLKAEDRLYDDNLYVALNADATYSVEPKKIDPRVSGLVTWRDAEGTFGVLATLSYYDRSTRTQISRQITTDTDDTIAGVANVFRPGILNYEVDDGSIERIGFGGTIQWRPTEDFELTADVLGSRQKTDRVQYSLRAFFPGDIGARVQNPLVDTAGTEGLGGILIRGTVPVNPAFGADQPFGQNLANRAVYDRDETSYGGHLRWQPGGGRLTLDLDAAYFETEFARGDDITGYGINGVTGFAYETDLRNGVPNFTFLPSASGTPFDVNAIRVGDPNEFGFNRIFAGGDQLSFRADARYEVGSFLSAVRVGLNYRKRKQDQIFNVIRYAQSDLVTIAAASGVSSSQLLDINANALRLVPRAAGGFLSEVSSVPYRSFLGINSGAVLGFYRPLIDASFAARGTSIDERGSNPNLGFNFGPFGSGGNFAGREEIRAAYAIADVDGRLFGAAVRGNFGVRLVETKRVGTGFVTATQINATTGNTIALDASGNPITTTNSSRSRGDDFALLPSGNISFQLTPKVQLRFAGSKVVSQPDLPQLAGPTNVGFTTAANGTTITAIGISRSNPDLKPFEANQFDAIVEWYPDRSGAFFAAGYFYKDIKNLVTSRTDSVDTFTINDVTYRATPTTTLQVSQPVNGDDGAKVSGLELQGHVPFSWLMGPAEGGLGGFIRNFGVQGTYTYLIDNETGETDALTGRQLPFPDASKNNYSVTGYYDDGVISSRVSYTYRSRSYTGIGFFGTGLFNDSFGALDANFDVKLSRNFSVRLQGFNLLEEATRQSTAGGLLPYYYAQNGRLVILGGRLQF